jgi:dethiobiotin synthetase
VNPITSTPGRPFVAGLLENRPWTPRNSSRAYQKLAAAPRGGVVEGAGGWEVPIAANYRVSDLAADLKLPVILVAANRLGALNHILLTVNAIRARGLVCAGIILNQLGDELDTAMITNKGVVGGPHRSARCSDHLIHGQDFLGRRTVPDTAVRATRPRGGQ